MKRVSPSFILILLAVGLGVGLRSFLARAYYGNFDQESFEIVAQIMQRGGNIYAETARYNYTPLWACLLWLLRQITAWTHLPAHFVFRSFLTFADVLNGILIGLIAAQVGRSGKIRLAAYALNPVAILIVGFQGQFENLAMFPLLLAVLVYQRRSSDPPLRWIWLFGTLSIIIKHITVFGVWMLFLYATTNRRALIMMLASGLVFLVTFLPYVPAGSAGILEHVFLYQGNPSLYGLGTLIPEAWSAPIFIGLMTVLPFVARDGLRLPLVKAMEFSFVAFLALTTGIGEQYFIMPVIWGSIFTSLWHWAFTIVATVFLAGSPYNLNLELPVIWNSVWLAATIWLLSYFWTPKAKSAESSVPQHSRRLFSPPRMLTWLFLASVLLVALFLRTYELDRLPPGPNYDEATAAILANQVARGQYLPVFITAYTGHEVLFYYLAAAVMQLAGATVFALRLTSALVGVATVMLTYRLARELFEDEPAVESHWLGLFAAALVATSFWHISVSRYGFRAITLPLMQSSMLLALWRGLRRDNWKWIVAAGVFCGLIAYTYLASRIVPAALAMVLPMILVAERQRLKLRLTQLGLATLIALLVFAPLGIFFLAHPEAFSARTEQLSIFYEGSAWQTTLGRNTLRALQVFTLRGDPDIRLNFQNQPMFSGALALAFYAGLVVVALRLTRASGFLGRVRYALLVLWPLVMLLPTILSDPAQVPHSLRAIGVMPLALLVPAVGMVATLGLIRRLVKSERVMTMLAAALFALTLGASVWGVFQDYFLRWGRDPRLYYENDGDVADMARYLNTLPDDQRTLYVSAPDYRHPTVTALVRSYDRIKWVQGGELFVFSPGPAVYAWPQATMPDSIWLAPFFPAGSRIGQGLGPDGVPAFVAHTRDQPPVLSPTHPLSATFGGVIQAIGYDVLRDRPSGGKTDVAVYWRVLRKPDRGDYGEFTTLQDAWGMQWAQSGSFAYPSEQWAPGEVIAERIRVQMEDGTPPGHYSLTLGWWSASTGQRLTALDAQERFAGTTIAVGPITVTRRIRPLDLNTVNISHRLDVEEGGLKLLGFDQWPASVRPGESEFVTLYWQALTASPPDRQVTLQMRVSDQRVVVLARSGPAHGTYPTSQWAADEFIADRLALHILPDTPPGTYTLEVQVDGLATQPLGRFDVLTVERN